MWILLFYNLKKYDIYLEISNLIVLYKVIIASLFMSIIVYISKEYLNSLAKLNIIIYIVISVISYITIIYLLKIEEIKDLFKLFFKYLKLK